MQHPFVISLNNRLGIGKLILRDHESATVEYFRSPADGEPIKHVLPVSSLRQKVLADQTRVYWQDNVNFSWKIGRVLDYQEDDACYLVKFPNDERLLIPNDELKVRCNLPIVDPTDHLAYQLNETAFWHDLRSDFVRHLLEQRRSNLGLTALVSSSIELVAHQMSVVQKVLLDPFQRYLLADEVGLGKTIEAGVLIKQFSLDQPLDHETLVIIPETLLIQWQQELMYRFHLGSRIGKSIHIVSSRDQSQICRYASTAKMIVIDEAHHFSSWAWSKDSIERETFHLVRDAICDLKRKVLLLSATPALHNEKSFLAMLHLLDPQVYSLDSLEDFKERVRIRQEIAECMLSLSASESNYFISDALEELKRLLVNDSEFQELSNKLVVLIEKGIAEDDPDRNALIRSIRSHVSDVWQLHRRILRNRRTEQTSAYLPGRCGVKIVEYSCEAEQGLYEAIDNWRLTLSASCFLASDEVKSSSSEAVKTAEEIAATGPRELISWATRRLEGCIDDEGDHLNQIIRAAKECDQATKLQKLLSLIGHTCKNVPYVLFTNSKATAELVFNFLELSLPEGEVFRHSIDNDNWRSFITGTVGGVLICDRHSEEGLNLQRKGTVAIHYDLPFSPNRLEQRMGRLDRFGQGRPVQSLVLVSSASRVQKSWFKLVSNALGVFDRSIATLQYLIEDELTRVWSEFLDSGADAIEDASARLGGEEGRVIAELKRIRAQDELEAFVPDQITQQISDNLEEEDLKLSQKSPEIFSKWLQDGLMFQKTGEPPRADKVFSYRFCRRLDTRSFRGNADTLMPKDEFENRFIHSIDNRPCEIPTRYITVPMTFDRVVAQRMSTRLLRVGDPLVDSFDEYTRWDDRGVCFAFWRYCPRYQPTEDPDVFFKIDYVLSPDPKPFEELCNREVGANLSSLMRRSMAIMKPAFTTIWLDSNLDRVTPKDVQFGRLLELPFQKSAQPWGRDYNLNSNRWDVAANQYDMSMWRDLCFAARRKSEMILREQSKLPEICQGCVEQARETASRVDQQFRSRIAMANNELRQSLLKEQDFERAFLEAQIESFSQPSLRVDSIGSVFLSSKNPFSTENLDRGREDDD